MLFVGATLSSLYKLKLILKPAILLKFTHFQLYIQNKQLRLLVVLWLPNILTVIYVIKKPSFLLKSWYYVFIIISWCVAANLSILERFKIKRPPIWWMSQYVYNKHNTTCKMLRTVFTHSLFLYQKSHSFAALTRSISDTSTTQHFPWSILYVFNTRLTCNRRRISGRR